MRGEPGASLNPRPPVQVPLYYEQELVAEHELHTITSKPMTAAEAAKKALGLLKNEGEDINGHEWLPITGLTAAQVPSISKENL